MLATGSTVLAYGAISKSTGAIVASKMGEFAMGKMIECAKVDPSSGCTHVIRGKDEQEVLKNAMEHGIREVTPELMEKVKAAIRDTD
jgi:predicted small metal-binding protein